MFQAQYLFEGTEVYSPWMPRGGDHMRASVDVIKMTGTGTQTLKIQVRTKKLEETSDDGTQVGSDWDRTATGDATQEFNGVNELVRYEFSYNTTGNASTDYVLFRMLDPVWYDAVNAGS